MKQRARCGIREWANPAWLCIEHFQYPGQEPDDCAKKHSFPGKKSNPTMPATQEVAEFLTFRRKPGGFRLRVTLEGRNLNLSDRDFQLSGRSGHRVQLIDAKFDLEERQSRN